jgi:spermidine/putrescine-binding protein
VCRRPQKRANCDAESVLRETAEAGANVWVDEALVLCSTHFLSANEAAAHNFLNYSCGYSRQIHAVSQLIKETKMLAYLENPSG